MKIKRISKATVIGWLKKIFTLQSLAVIAGFIAAFFAYKTYQDNKPAQITTEYYSDYESINIDEKIDIVNLISPNCFDRALYYRNGFITHINFPDSSGNNRPLYMGNGYPTRSFPCGIPSIRNNSSKAIMNFRLDIDISYASLCINKDKISPYYEIVENDTILRKMVLRYKYNVLNAKSSIPLPFSCMYLSDSICGSTGASLLYRMTYDGIDVARVLRVFYFLCFDETYPDVLTDDCINEFLTTCYDGGYFTNRKKRTLVAIIDKYKTMVVNPPKRLNDVKFEKFKKKFIEDFNK